MNGTSGVIESTASSQLEESIACAVPVVSRGGVSMWPALARWSVGWFGARFADRRLPVRRSSTGRFGDGYETVELSVARYCELMAKGEAADLYLQQASIPTSFPELVDELEPPSWIPGRDVHDTNIWISPGGAVTTLHYDHFHNCLVQIQGTKRVSLVEPARLEACYPGPPNTATAHICRVDVEAPDLDRHPAYAGTSVPTVELGAGDLLFIPAYWIHHVRSLGDSLSVNTWWRPPPRSCPGPGFVRLLASNRIYYNIDALGSFVRLPDTDLTRLPLELLEENRVEAAALVTGALVVRWIIRAFRRHRLDLPPSLVNREEQMLAAVAAVPGVGSVDRFRASLELGAQCRRRQYVGDPAAPATIESVCSLLDAVAGWEEITPRSGQRAPSPPPRPDRRPRPRAAR